MKQICKVKKNPKLVDTCFKYHCSWHMVELCEWELDTIKDIYYHIYTYTYISYGVNSANLQICKYTYISVEMPKGLTIGCLHTQLDPFASQPMI